MFGLGNGSQHDQATRDELASLAAEYRDLYAADAERLARYQQYRDENSEAREVDIDHFASELEDYGKRVRTTEPRRHNVPLPFGRALTVKHAHRISGRIPDAVVERRAETPEEAHRSDTMEKMVWGIWRESGGKATFASAAWDASELGAACFAPYFDIRKQMPVVQALDPAGMLVVRGAADPHNFQRVYRFWTAPRRAVRAEYRDLTFRGLPVEISRVEADIGVNDLTTIVEASDKYRTIRFTLGGEVGLYENQHDLGFAPYVVIPNLGPEREVWGWADYEFVRVLGRYLGRQFSREADVLRMVSGGAYKMVGKPKVSSETVRQIIQKGGVLALGSDSDVAPIDAPNIPDFNDAHTQRGLQYLKMLGFAPDAAWGDGAAGSGSDRGLQLQPMIEFTAMKQVNWAAGLGRLFSMCFQMIESKQATPASYRGVHSRGNKRSPFNFQIGPGLDPLQQDNPNYDEADVNSGDQIVLLPRTPAELFDGDYAVEFEWNNRVDPSDPAFVQAELNKFVQGVQSLQTTLENLGVRAPEDEIKRIQDEAEQYPWIRDGMLKMIEMQLNASQQGQGGGNPGDPQQAMMDSLSTMTGGGGGASGALNADATGSTLPGTAGVLHGAA